MSNNRKNYLYILFCYVPIKHIAFFTQYMRRAK